MSCIRWGMQIPQQKMQGIKSQLYKNSLKIIKKKSIFTKKKKKNLRLWVMERQWFKLFTLDFSKSMKTKNQVRHFYFSFLSKEKN